jgi:WD40 repeat protein
MAGSEDDALEIWRVGGAKEVETIGWADGDILALVVNEGEDTAATLSKGGFVQLWDVERRQPSRKIGPLKKARITFTRVPEMLVVVEGGHRVHLFDLKNGSETDRELSPTGEGVVSGLDGQFLAYAETMNGVGGTSNVFVADLEKGLLVSRLAADGREPDVIRSARIGRGIAAGDMDQTLTFWRDYLDDRTKEQLVGHNGTITDFSISRDSKFAATSSRDGTVRYWDLASGKSLYARGGTRDWIEAITLTQNGTAAAISEYGQVDVFSLSDGNTRWTINLFDKYVGNNSFWIKHAQSINKGEQFLAASGSDTALKLVSMKAVEAKLSEALDALVSEVRRETRLELDGRELLPEASQR